MSHSKLSSVQVLDAIEQQILDRLNTLHKDMNSLQADIAADGKSTAGDKHETGRAMIHLEQERLSEQSREVELQLSHIKKLREVRQTHIITNGSLVQTTAHLYFVGIGAGKVMVDGVAVFAVSVQSPIGALLLGKSKGDEVVFGNKKISIVDVC